MKDPSIKSVRSEIASIDDESIHHNMTENY
jgi:hypothetical protein